MSDRHQNRKSSIRENKKEPKKLSASLQKHQNKKCNKERKKERNIQTKNDEVAENEWPPPEQIVIHERK